MSDPVQPDSDREALRGALTNVLSNASNYPVAVRVRLLGRDMGPLTDRVADAILAAGFARHPQQEAPGDKWQYARQYTDEGGGKHRSRVSVDEARDHLPDGHRADGTPYWNHTLVRRRKAGPWLPVDDETQEAGA